MRQLSKSKILAYRQCPKRLWLEIHRPELKDDSSAETAYRIGNEVGEVARRIYDKNGDGVFIDIDVYKRQLRHQGRPRGDDGGHGRTSS